MGNIYAFATNVIVWLGKDKEDLDGFNWIYTEFWAALSSDSIDDDKVMKSRFIDRDFTDQLGFLVSVETWMKKWVSYFRFLRRHRYFCRVWIVNEVALATDVTVLCGDTVLQWERLCGIACLLSNTGWSLEMNAQGEKHLKRPPIGTELSRLKAMQQWYQRGVEDGERSNLLTPMTALVSIAKTERDHWFCLFQDLLYMTPGLKATNPREKVYALLGLASRYMPAGMTLPIQPDYRASVRDIYTSTAKLLLQNIPTLSTLSLIEDGSRRKQKEFPSWVLDFGCTFQGLSMVYNDDEDNFNASVTELQGSNPPIISGYTLTISGVCFDTVIKVGEAMDAPKSIKAILELCLELPSHNEATCQQRLQALLKTCIAGHELADLSTSFHNWVLAVAARAIATADIGIQDMEPTLEALCVPTDVSKSEGLQ